ncbi:sensor histidine kinase [Demequina globuliformis]|uniref:sensor histidine kinase n=1 Tax=Demequina globuliformis TaxID=676202 RepID=UPI000785CC92|nr:ATP-binding protein [Demequina globuliformis]
MSPSHHAARHRLQRVLYFACGIGAVVFGLLMAFGDSGILAARGQLDDWYWWTALIIGVALPSTYLVTAFTVPLRYLHAIALVTVVGFVVVQLLWVPAMHELTLHNGATPWLQGINALPSTLAGVLFANRVVWVFPASQLFLVPLVQLSSSDTTVGDAILDGCGAVIFCSILTGMALAVVESGDTLDAASSKARRVAARRSMERGRARELTRINAIVHDDVMSVLLAASRVGATAAVKEQAARAQVAIASLTEAPDTTHRTYEGAEFVAAVRGLPADAGVTAQVHDSIGPSAVLPGAAVAALTEAASEALRNCAQHAGPQATIQLDVEVSATGASITIHDDGPGFDPQDVDPRRLGIAVSIAERMHSVRGGSSMITSRPGEGTSVTVSWRQQ